MVLQDGKTRDVDEREEGAWRIQGLLGGGLLYVSSTDLRVCSTLLPLNWASSLLFHLMKEEREADAYEAHAGTRSQIKQKKRANLVELNYYNTSN